MAQTQILKQKQAPLASTADWAALAETVTTSGPVGPEQAAAIRGFVTTELPRYLAQLDDIARRHVGGAVGDPALIREFEQASDVVTEAGQRAADRLEPTAAKRLKAAFRSVVAPRMAGSPFMERGLAKPRGYAGDYLMMELRYDDQVELGEGLRGLFDRYAFDYYRLIKDRNEKIKRILSRCLRDPQRSGSAWRACTMGAGPCREWVDLEQQLGARAAAGPVLPQAHLTCLDRDAEALTYAKARLRGNRLLRSTEFVPADLLKFADSEAWARHAGRYDLVYALGLANYFYDIGLGVIIETGFRLLKPGGELIITHKALETFNFLIPDWFCDWTFVQRGEADFTRCFQEALAPHHGQYEWRMDWEHDEEMFGVIRRLA